MLTTPASKTSPLSPPHHRYPNSPAEELLVAAGEQQKITELRLLRRLGGAEAAEGGAEAAAGRRAGQIGAHLRPAAAGVHCKVVWVSGGACSIWTVFSPSPALYPPPTRPRRSPRRGHARADHDARARHEPRPARSRRARAPRARCARGRRRVGAARRGRDRRGRARGRAAAAGRARGAGPLPPPLRRRRVRGGAAARRG
jgi:hypothetical protein